MLRSLSILSASSFALLVWALPALAQPATTVQLPTYRIFSVQTTVSVPDGGGAYLGGINSARDSSTTRGFGPLGSRGIGMERGAGGMSVHATIIDHAELDAALLAEAAARRAPADPAAAKAAALSSHVGKGIAPDTDATTSAEASSTADSVAAIRARNAAAAEARASEAAGYFAKAEQAEADGKPAVAGIFYQMVARRDAGELGKLAAIRLELIAGTSRAVTQR